MASVGDTVAEMIEEWVCRKILLQCTVITAAQVVDVSALSQCVALRSVNLSGPYEMAASLFDSTLPPCHAGSTLRTCVPVLLSMMTDFPTTTTTRMTQHDD